MITLTLEEFNQTAKYLNASEVEYNNHIYRRGASCSIRQKDTAIKYCKLHQSKNLLALIVEQNGLLTVWLQKAKSASNLQSEPVIDLKPIMEQVQNSASRANNMIVARSSNNQIKSKTEPLKPQSDSTPKTKTKKITRKYRGQTYEVEVPIVDNQSESNPRRMYRGKPY